MLQAIFDWFDKFGFTLGWISIGVAIILLEAWAIFNKKTNDTLSEHIWALIDFFKDGGVVGKFGLALFTIAVCGLFGWLALHFFTRQV